MSNAKMRGAIVLAKSLAAVGADGELAHALANAAVNFAAYESEIDERANFISSCVELFDCWKSPRFMEGVMYSDSIFALALCAVGGELCDITYGSRRFLRRGCGADFAIGLEPVFRAGGYEFYNNC
ncbi:MAG: hypothetical protein FWD15_03265 [Alphaproteobacteria bacterium]|nr:hypothetical protein [Alphaproteobacteria bacterium]